MPRPRLSKLLKRTKDAWGEKDNWDTLLRDTYKYAMPQRFHDPKETNTKGQMKGSDVFDSTAISSLQRFQARIVQGMFPPGRHWAKLVAGPAVPEEQKREINEQLELAVKIAFDVINNATNFNTAIGEYALDLGAGTAGMIINRSKGSEHLLDFVTMNPMSYAIETGPNGLVSGVFRKPKVKARNLELTWPDMKLTDELKAIIADQPNKEIETLHEAAYKDFDTGTWYYDVYLETQKTKGRLVMREYNSTPMVVTRFIRASNEAHGRGPLMTALPDIKTLNKLIELVLKNAALAVSGVYTAVDDGVLNPDAVRITPGGVVKVARNQGHPAGASLAPLERSADFNVAVLERDDLRMSIKKILLDSSLPELNQPVRSATEFIERAKELSQDLGAAFGRLVTEAAVPIFQRTIDVLIDMGIITLPRGFKISGANVKMIVTAPLANLQNLDELDTIIRTYETVAQLFGPELAMMAFKVEELPGKVAELLGFPSDMLRDDAEKEQMQQQIQQMMAAMQAQQAGPAGQGAEQGAEQPGNRQLGAVA